MSLSGSVGYKKVIVSKFQHIVLLPCGSERCALMGIAGKSPIRVFNAIKNVIVLGAYLAPIQKWLRKMWENTEEGKKKTCATHRLLLSSKISVPK